MKINGKSPELIMMELSRDFDKYSTTFDGKNIALYIDEVRDRFDSVLGHHYSMVFSTPILQDNCIFATADIEIRDDDNIVVLRRSATSSVRVTILKETGEPKNLAQDFQKLDSMHIKNLAKALGIRIQTEGNADYIIDQHKAIRKYNFKPTVFTQLFKCCKPPDKSTVSARNLYGDDVVVVLVKDYFEKMSEKNKNKFASIKEDTEICCKGYYCDGRFYAKEVLFKK
jgi:hypothetical protein